MPTIGPALPSHLQKRGEEAEEDEEEDDFGPALPPSLAQERANAAAGPSKPQVPAAVVPSKYAPQPPRSNQIQPEDDSDDEYGPKPVTGGVQAPEKDAVQEFMEREKRRQELIEEAKKPVKPQRPEWMLAPPSSSDLLYSLDPKKLQRGRTFNPTSGGGGASKNKDMNLWTETPAERQKRLADEVLGLRKAPAGPQRADEEEEEGRKRKREADEDMRRKVARIRGPALVDSHHESDADKVGEKEEEGSAIWEHGRDMALGGRLMDDSKRQGMIKEAKALGGRFQSSGSGGFL